jgi:GT2 family glycosyltransferase
VRLLVVGMHRSGTSAVGRILDGMGVASGAPDEMMGADPSNPFGHFEVRRLTEFNDRVLHHLGGHWSGPPAASAGEIRALADGPLGAEAAALVDRLLPADGWFFKDPRLSLLLPFWTAVLGPAAVLYVHRHPSAIAASLASRDGFPLGYGFQLWQTYACRALAAVAGTPTFVLSYEALIDEPRPATEAVGRFLVEHSVADHPDTAAASDLVEPSVRHHHADDAEASMAPSAAALHSFLRSSAGAVLGPVPSDLVVPPPRSDAMELRAVDGHALDEGREATARAAALGDEVDRLRGELATEAALAQREVDRLDDELAAAQAVAQRELDRLEQELAGVHADARIAIRRLEAERDHAVAAGRRQVAELYHRLRQADADLQMRDRQLRGLTTSADALERQLDELLGSNAFHAIALMRAGVNRLLPGGTVRRRVYSSAVRESADMARRVHRRGRGLGDGPDEGAPPVELPVSQQPVAAIVVPAYGQRQVTARCLEALRRADCETPMQVVVVDDCSPDDTAAFLARCRGLTVVSNETNMGFLRATNAGVAAAGEAPFVVLLNNDTEVTPGWLDALIAPFEDPSVGAVGAKLIYPDGKLQEAGSIVWRDGSGWNYGRGDLPDRFPYNHSREVDYCSAACLAVRRETWDRVCGFDERFVPAYYEDTDLCFAIRAIGQRVLFQPRAVVVHHEGLSHGTDESPGGKIHQQVNRLTFVDKWRDDLESQLPNDPTNVRRASDRRAGPRVLVVDHQVPTPDRDSGSVRMSKLLAMLVELRYRVTFLPFNRYRYPPYDEALTQSGIELIDGTAPLSAVFSELADDLAIAILSRPMVAANVLPDLLAAAPHVRLVYDMVDYHGLREEREADQNAGPAGITGEVELALARRADLTFAVSDEERELVARLRPDATVVTIPNVHDVPLSRTPFRDRSGLLFVGSWAHPPNRDAIEYLLHSIMPGIRERLPGVSLTVVGSDVPPDIAAGHADVETLGWVPDLAPIFDRVRLSLAPLRFGAGMKGKVGDSMARGVPVVATSVAAEGFGFGGDELSVADDVAAFVGLVEQLYEDEMLWLERSRAGRAAVERTLGFSAVKAELAKALDGLSSDVAS